MILEHAPVGVTEQKKLKGGETITITKVRGPEIAETIDPVALHEACHTLAALVLGIPVHRVSTVPGPGYLGVTELGAFNPVVAAAAAAWGCDGAGDEDSPGSDIWQIKHSGEGISSALSRARHILDARRIELYTIASAIQRSRTISGSEAAHAKREAEHGTLLEVRLRRADGRETTVRRTVRPHEPIPPIELAL